MSIFKADTKKISGQVKFGKNVLSMHPVVAGDVFYWDRGVWDKNLFEAIKKAYAIILPQTVGKELYCLCTKMCPHVFPNYDLRFQWEGKMGDTLAFWASNTSVIPITKIMQNLNGKHRALGTHWWNPAHMIPLVEVIKTKWTDGKYAKIMFDLLLASGKSPVMVEKDVPGFIGNRLQHALWREAISLVEKGICDAESVDTVVKESFGRRLAVLGPLENADLVGTDLTLDIHQNVLFDLDNRQGTSPYLQNMVNRGELGMKTGQGFRSWTKEDSIVTGQRVSKHLQKLAKILKN